MIRRIIQIDAEKCNGCSLCVDACHEGAIAMKDGKAYLTRDDYCDGLGDCLPNCPTNAISFIEKDTLPFDKEAVEKNMAEKKACSCPGSAPQTFAQQAPTTENVPTMLRQWPVQIQLVHEQAAFFNGADLLIAADCSAYAYGNFHSEFMHGKVTLIGCPKLDNTEYSQKLTEILAYNDINSVTVTRMVVPCCGGIEHAVRTAVANCGKQIPLEVVTLSTQGEIIKK